jgi:hypothetical protein
MQAKHVDAADILGAQNLIHQFFRSWDERDAQTVGAMMAPEGIWHRGGKVRTGAQGIREAMDERKPNTTTAHIVNNLIVRPADGAADLEVSCYLTTYNEPKPQDESVTPLTLPRSLVLYVYKLVRLDGRWRVLEINSTPVFRR